jgi:hypothetical protein
MKKLYLLVIILLSINFVLAQNFDASVQPSVISLFNCQETTVSVTIKNNEILNGLKYTIYYENSPVASGSLWPLQGSSHIVSVKAADAGSSQKTITREIRIEASTVLGGSTKKQSLILNVNSGPSEIETRASNEMSQASAKINSASSYIANANSKISEARSYGIDVSSETMAVNQAESSLKSAQNLFSNSQEAFNRCRTDLSNFNDAINFASQSKELASSAITSSQQVERDAQRKIEVYKAKLAASGSITNAQNAMTAAQSSIVTAQNAISQASSQNKDKTSSQEYINSALSDFNKAKEYFEMANNAFVNEEYSNAKSYAESALNYANSAKEKADKAYNEAVNAPVKTTVPNKNIIQGQGIEPVGKVVGSIGEFNVAILIFAILAVIVIFWFFFMKKKGLKNKGKKKS